VASLLRKELQIQKAAFVLAAMMCLVSVLMALAWDVDHLELLFAMTAVPIAVLVFVIPMITPGGCVAEERNWGVSDWQRALPVSARKQWAAKMLVVIFTSVLLGVVVPAALWLVDGWVFQLPNGARSLQFDRLLTVPLLADFLVAVNCMLGYLLFAGFGVFTSSLCANSAKAVIMNLGLMIGSASLAAGAFSVISTAYYHVKLEFGIPPADLFFGFLGQIPGQLTLWSLFAILLGIIQCLALFNYRNGEPGPRSAWTQLSIVAGSTAGLAGIFWTLSCLTVHPVH
jgi:hypothetical protein